MRPLFRIIIIIAVIVLLALAVYFGWKLLTGGEEPVPVGENPPAGGGLPVVPVTPGGTPAGGAGEPLPGGGETPGTPGQTGVVPKKLSDFPVFAFTVASGTQEAVYLTPLGKAYAAKEGPDLELSSETFTALQIAAPSPDGSKLLVASGDPHAPQWVIFDAADRAWRPLPQEILTATWDIKANGLIAIIQNGSVKDLVRADLTSTPPKYQTLVKGFSIADVDLLALTTDAFLVIERPSAIVGGRVWRWNAKAGLLELVLPSAAGRMIGATADRKVLFSYASPDEFRIMNRNFQELEPVTWYTFPEKCGGGASTTYCFVPSNIPEAPRPILPDDYLMGTLRTVDELYRIDFTTGDVVKVLSGTGNYTVIDAREIIPAPVGVYYLNKTDAALYVLTNQ